MSTLHLLIICATVCWVSLMGVCAVEEYAKAKYGKHDKDPKP